MKCSKCEFDNSEEMLYCGKCGKKMERQCPQCHFANPPQFLFCGKCGQELKISPESTKSDLSVDEKIAKIQKYLPKGLTDKILSQKDRIEGEHKQITVMFCDMKGFTGLVEKLGSEESYEIMDQVYEILIHKVHDYGGTVNEMTGDGVMALFGAPIALEGAAHCAVRSSLAIHREMAKFNDRLKQDGKDIPSLNMRVGINSGPVVVGTLGNNLRVEFKVVGDTVNMASRMESLAEQGTTNVTEGVFRLTEGLFRFESLGEKQVKGKEDLVKVYQVIASNTRKTRFDVSAERGLTPFVGRKPQLELLLDGFKRSKEGLGQGFSIVSEAGVGKSRLLYEFRKAVSNEDITFLEGRCFSYSKGVAYYPLVDVLKSNFNIQEGDKNYEIEEKVKNGLKVLGADEATTLSSLMALLSSRENDIGKFQIDPDVMKARITEALKQVIFKGSEFRPLIIAFEDIHWIDKSSKDCLGFLLDSISGARIFLIFTYRPEFVATWRTKSYHSQLNLYRLSNREILQMGASLLGVAELARDIEELFLDKTGGIPFFLEEFTRSLIEMKLIQKVDGVFHLTQKINEKSIPSTIQDIIMARVDSLPEAVKEVLHMSSAIEREFAYDLIKQVVAIPEQELDSYLSILKDSELLYERGLSPQSTYIFKHALIREVVYSSLLSKKKIDIHERIGHAIEHIYNYRLDDFFETLAFHFEQGEVWNKALEYHVKAGIKARQVYSIDTAMTCFDRAKQIMTEHDPNITWRIRFDLLFGEGRALMDLGRGIYALKNFKNAEIIAKQEGQSDLIPQVMFSEAEAAWLSYEINHMEAILEELESLVAHNAEDLLGVVIQQVWCFFGLGNIKAVLSKEKEMSELITKARESVYAPQAAHNIGLFQRWRGDSDKCIITLKSALPVLKESATPMSYLGATFQYGLALGERGKYQQAINILEKGQKFGLKSGERYTTPKLTNSLGWVYNELCLYKKAKYYNNMALESIKELLGPGTSTLFEIESNTRINLAENYLMMKKYKDALDNLGVVYGNARKLEYNINRWRWKPRCLLRLTETWLLLGDFDKAELYFNEIKDDLWLNEFPYKKYQVNVCCLKSRFLLKNFRFQDAEIEMNQALTQAKKLKNPTLLWKTHQSYGELYLKLDKINEAKSEFQKAIKNVQYIADELTDSRLKIDYLQSKTIQELFVQGKINKNSII